MQEEVEGEFAPRTDAASIDRALDDKDIEGLFDD